MSGSLEFQDRPCLIDKGCLIHTFIHFLLVYLSLHVILTIEIATSAPRGGNHMGQVGVVSEVT